MSDRSNWPVGAWSYTQSSELARCNRAHTLRYVRGVSLLANKPLPLSVGDYGHKVLEYVGRECLRGSPADDHAYEEGARQAQMSIDDLDAIIEGTRLIGAYRMRYGDELAGWDGWDLVDVERTFRAKDLHASIGGYAQIADVVLRDPGDGKLCIAERKFLARRPNGIDKDPERVIRGLRTRPQLLGLAFCARDELGEVADIIYDVIVKTRVVGFERIRVPIDNELLDRWGEDQHKREKLIGLDIPNWDQCDPPYGFPCWAFDWCHGTTADRVILYQIKKRPQKINEDEGSD